MISFGNTLLYQRMANEINRTSLDIRIGMVHAAGTRPESLNLDLADLFKPILVDRTIFTLVNSKMLNKSDFIEVENEVLSFILDTSVFIFSAFLRFLRIIDYFHNLLRYNLRLLIRINRLVR